MDSVTIDVPRKRLLRVNNVARRTGIPERTIRHLAATGRLVGVRLGRKIWAFHPDAIDAFERRRTNETAW
jgi:excisionase family DNA binding protein